MSVDVININPLGDVLNSIHLLFDSVNIIQNIPPRVNINDIHLNLVW